jgi:hypothetical protein
MTKSVFMPPAPGVQKTGGESTKEQEAASAPLTGDRLRTGQEALTAETGDLGHK